MTEKLVPDYKTFTYKGHRYEVEIIPVKYDFGQLAVECHTGQVALAGNTIGIVGAIVNINTDAHATAGVDERPAGVDESDLPKVRNI